MYVCIYMCVYICMYMCIYIYIIHTHTYIYILFVLFLWRTLTNTLSLALSYQAVRRKGCMVNTIMCWPDLSFSNQQFHEAKRKTSAASCLLGLTHLIKNDLAQILTSFRNSLPNDGSLQGYKGSAPSFQLRTTSMISPASEMKSLSGLQCPILSPSLFLP